MAIPFDFFLSPPKDGEEDKLNVHARPVLTSTVDTEKLAAIIHNRTSQSVGDIYSTIISLGQVISEQLSSGRRVYLDGIGYFSVSLSCKNIYTEKDMRANNVSFKSVTFRAHKHLKSDLKQTRLERSAFRSHSARLTNEEIDRRLAKYFEENHVMTRRNFQHLCEMKQGTASRHIHRLLKEGKIKNIGIDRQPIYVLNGEK